MKKQLPEAIKFYDEAGDIMSNPTSDIVNAFVKRHKVKDFVGEHGTIPARDVVKNFLSGHLNSTDEEEFEIPEGMDSYQKVYDECKDTITDHVKACKEEKETMTAEKEAKRQQREAEKEAKKAEDKTFSDNSDSFVAALERKAKAVKSLASPMIKSVTEGVKMPTGISFNANGMGLNVGDSMDAKTIGEAAASLLNAMEGQEALQGALQFGIGDLVNASVRNRIFRTKGDAANSIKFAIEERLKKSYHGSSISYMASMAERVTLDQRKPGVTFSLYMEASKIVLPRLAKDTPKDKLEELTKEYEQFRNDVIEAVNSGDVASIKSIKEKATEFAKSKGIIKSSPQETKNKVAKMLRQFYFAVLAKESIVGLEKPDVAIFEADKGAVVEYPVAKLTDLEQEAKNELQNILVPNADKVFAGFEMRIVDKKKNKPEKVMVYMPDPFTDKEEAPAPVEKKEEEKPEEQEETQTEE